MDGVSASAAGLLSTSSATSPKKSEQSGQSDGVFAALVEQSQQDGSETISSAKANARPTGNPTANSENTSFNTPKKTGLTDGDPAATEGDLVGLSVVQSILNAPLRKTAEISSTPATLTPPVQAPLTDSATTTISPTTAPDAQAAPNSSTDKTQTPNVQKQVGDGSAASTAASANPTSQPPALEDDGVVDQLFQRIMAKGGKPETGAATTSQSTSTTPAAISSSTSSIPISQALLMMQGKTAPTAAAATNGSGQQGQATEGVTQTQQTQPSAGVATSQAQSPVLAQATQHQATTGRTASRGGDLAAPPFQPFAPNGTNPNAVVTSAAASSKGSGQNSGAQSQTQSGASVAIASGLASKVGDATPPSSPSLDIDLTEIDVGDAETPELADADTAKTNANGRAGQAATPAVLRSASSIASQAWSTMIQRFDGRSQQYQIRLDPAELGKIDVSIEISKDNKARIVMAVQSTEAMNELSRSARALEQALAQSGVDLSEEGLNLELSENESGSFTFSDDTQDNEDENASSSAQNAANHPTDDEPVERALTPQLSIWNRPGVNLTA